MSASDGHGVFFLGAKPDVLNKAVDNAVAQNPGLQVVGHHHGYFEDDSDEERAIVDAIRASEAKLLFVGISSPKKELFIERNRERLGVCFVMGVGGTFDVVAGKVLRAPTWMQSAGLEWLFRLMQEPRRMWRRYLETNLRFAWLLMRARVGAEKT
jgi:N-acetylglucosaminyldiphosphoundecaprenol N-acetyl-beta-D-mannosaminyltransferase